jgi:diguanylate cyclase (GGDEF)-like protein
MPPTPAAPNTIRSPLTQRRRRSVDEAIDSLRILPTSVTVPMRVIQLQRSETASVRDYADALIADPALAAKVLALVNSAAFHPTRPITKVSDAVNMIGMKNLLSLVFGTSLSGIFNKMGLPPSEVRALWRAAVLKAVTAQECALVAQSPRPEEAFLCGILQDIGLAVLYAADPSAWPETCSMLDLDDGSRETREIAMYGIDHATVGQSVARRLGLPEFFQASVGAHHEPPDAVAALIPDNLADGVHAAAALPHRLVAFNSMVLGKAAVRLKAVSDKFPTPLERPDQENASAEPAEEPPAEPESAKAPLTLPQRIAHSYSGTLRMLGDADVSTTAFNQLIQALTAQVAQTLESAIGESTATIVTLKNRSAELDHRIKALEKQVLETDFDTLTKTLTRRAFFNRAQHFFKLSHEYHTACAMGFADLDNLKRVNDTYGHSAGDLAICTIASRLAATVHDKGILARMGGDEFAFLVISRSPEENQQLAKLFSDALRDMTVTTDGQTLPLTASVGLIWLGIPALQPTIEDMVHSADQLMYKAKKAGKARCVVGQVADQSNAA